MKKYLNVFNFSIIWMIMVGVVIFYSIFVQPTYESLECRPEPGYSKTHVSIYCRDDHGTKILKLRVFIPEMENIATTFSQ